MKIITLPEDQVQEEMENEGGVEGGTGREDDLANAMSLLLDSLLVKTVYILTGIFIFHD